MQTCAAGRRPLLSATCSALLTWVLWPIWLLFSEICWCTTGTLLHWSPTPHNPLSLKTTNILCGCPIEYTNNGLNKGQKGFTVAHLNFAESVWGRCWDVTPCSGNQVTGSWRVFNALWIEKNKTKDRFYLDCSTFQPTESSTFKTMTTSAKTMTCWSEKQLSDMADYFTIFKYF